MTHATLIDTAALAANLEDPGWLIFDCRFSLADPGLGRRQYAQGHIPGARFADLEQDLSGPVGPRTGRHPLPDPEALGERLGRWGVGPGIQVVAYDDAGGGYAVRLWWLLRWLGHGTVAVLDGGYPAWVAEGRPTTHNVPPEAPRRFQGHPNDAHWVSTEAVQRELATGDCLLVDGRIAERYRGEVEPIDPVAGHIPGAVNLSYLDNLGPDGRFLHPAALRGRFEQVLGLLAPERVVHMCGSGVTAIHNLLAMEVAGQRGSRLYPGSWSEWIRSASRPVATGSEPGGTAMEQPDHNERR